MTGGIIYVAIARCDADSEGVDSNSKVNGEVDNEGGDGVTWSDR
jgi:hypothetical protein